MISSEDVQTFLAVVRTGSLLQAAELIATTQSTVSYRIQSLEKQLGHSLLLRARGTRQVSLTEDGERFLDIAERWEMLQLEADELKSKHDRHLSIGAVDALAIHVLPAVFSALAMETPKIRLHLETARYWALLNRVASGHLSFAFTLTPVERQDLVSVQLREYATVIAYMPAATDKVKAGMDMTAFDPTMEVYLPWSTELDIWRQKRGLSRLVTSIDKSHLLAPLLSRERAWALVPAFMKEGLAASTGCSFHTLKRFPPPPIHVYMTSRRSLAGVSRENKASLEAALKQLG